MPFAVNNRTFFDILPDGTATCRICNDELTKSGASDLQYHLSTMHNDAAFRIDNNSISNKNAGNFVPITD